MKQWDDSDHNVANQDILIMVRSLTLKWKQIIGYELCKNHLDVDSINQLMMKSVESVTKCGYKVRCTVMDQEPSQWKWVKTLNVCPERPFFSHQSGDIFIMLTLLILLKILGTTF